MLNVRVSLYHIALPTEWEIDYWTSYCRTVRAGQEVVLTNSDVSQEALKRKVAEELSPFEQNPIFEEFGVEGVRLNKR